MYIIYMSVGRLVDMDISQHDYSFKATIWLRGPYVGNDEFFNCHDIRKKKAASS